MTQTNPVLGVKTTDTVLRQPSLKSIYGIGRSTTYALIKAGKFPAPIRLGARSVGWLRSECDNWLAERVAESRSAVKGGA